MWGALLAILNRAAKDDRCESLKQAANCYWRMSMGVGFGLVFFLKPSGFTLLIFRKKNILKRDPLIHFFNNKWSFHMHFFFAEKLTLHSQKQDLIRINGKLCTRHKWNL